MGLDLKNNILDFNELDKVFTKRGISYAELKVLCILAEQGESKLGDIKKVFPKAVSTLHAQLNSLVDKGIIRRKYTGCSVSYDFL